MRFRGSHNSYRRRFAECYMTLSLSATPSIFENHLQSYSSESHSFRAALTLSELNTKAIYFLLYRILRYLQRTASLLSSNLRRPCCQTTAFLLSTPRRPCCLRRSCCQTHGTLAVYGVFAVPAAYVQSILVSTEQELQVDKIIQYDTKCFRCLLFSFLAL